MNFPRIYSLSTVGVLKHYVHDYLFHPVRTDFIGPNGVGKSIIADLMQLMFIYDNELIRFGTDGLQQEKRSVETLPYKTRLAYCFLNIEVSSNQFITTGILINGGRGKRVTPFVILKNADLNQPIEHLCLTAEDIIFANGVVNASVIPDITDLASRLLKEKNIYLRVFRSKEDINEYYRFLYEKNILPVNLSNEKSLSAYAKVIQSFSKAKSLNLSGAQASRSLKEFLFEESDEDILFSYSAQQMALEKILKEYKRLNEDITALEKKLKKLIELKEQNEKYVSLYKEYRKTELSITFNSWQYLETQEGNARRILQQNQNECTMLKGVSERLPLLKSKIGSAFNTANANYDLHIDYEKLTIKDEELTKEINEVRMLILPEVDDSWKVEVGNVDISTRSAKIFKDEIDFAVPYLKRYKTLNAVINERSKQKALIDDLKRNYKVDKEEREKLYNLLLNEGEKSFIHWFISKGPVLTKDQTQLLLYFAPISVSEIENPLRGERVLDPEQLFKDFEIKTVAGKKGYWLKLGAISEFVEFNPDASLFEGKKDLGKSVKKITDRLKNEILDFDSKIAELIKVDDGHFYSKKILDFDFDLTIVENSNIEKLKTAVACIIRIDEKLNLLKRDSENNQKALGIIRVQINASIIGHEPEVVKRSLNTIRNRCNGRQSKIALYIGTIESELKAALKDSALSNASLLTIIENLLHKEAEFKNLNAEYFETYQENVEEYPAVTELLDIVEGRCKEAFESYKTNYITTTQIFDETSNSKNTSINIEIANKNYSFRVLEEALLGTRIRTTDDIAAALSEANQNRLNIADGIRDNMIKVFENTISRYKKYKEQVQGINVFFKGRKISDRFFFKLGFTDNKTIDIALVSEMANQIRTTAKQGELPFNQSVDEFIEDFFKKMAKLKDKIPIDKLLSPKTYFDLGVSLTDESDTEIPGSTGETYSAIALLGIARLSVVNKEQRKGLRFIILEEIGSLDNTNFNTFPAIASEFGYQIITMAPHAFNISLSDEWYGHHLIKGKSDKNINYYPAASYFKTKNGAEDLSAYLSKLTQ
jgi:DNA repair protein SbcC/Rad50